MQSVLTVVTPASNYDLTTLEAVKTDLNILVSTEDEYISRQIKRASSAICAYLNIASASDGSRTLGRETLSESFRQATCKRVPEIVLSRYPVASISSIYSDGELVGTSSFEASGSTGIIQRVGDVWNFTNCVVNYTAGWTLPTETNSSLPPDIEDAAIELIKSIRFNRTRDPLLRSENILESLYSYTLFAPSDTPSGLPATVAALLEPYRNITV